MRHQASTFALLALPATVLAVSLADFKPRVDTLPAACATVYTQTIDGCVPTDFTTSACSAGCINALQTLVFDVKRACGNCDIRGTNVIVAFLNNAGPQGLCNNADAVLGGSGGTSTTPDTSAPTSSSSSPAAIPTEKESSTTSEAPTTTDIDRSQTATDTASTTFAPTSTFAPDTSSIPTAAPTRDSSSSTPTAAPTRGSSQSSANDGSGGGSPFDTGGNMISAGSALGLTMAAMLFAVSITLAGALR